MERRANLLGGSGVGVGFSCAKPFFRQCPHLVLLFSKIAVRLYLSLIANVGTWYRMLSRIATLIFMLAPYLIIYITHPTIDSTQHTSIMALLNRDS